MNSHMRTEPLLLRATVLLCGAVGMILELAGSRLLAPYFGNGLFVWTALIGIMLGFMSLGNFLGGRLGDRMHSPEALFWILTGSSAGIAVVTFTEPLLLPVLSGIGMPRMGAVAAASALFGLPCTLLGMVTPYSTRCAIHSVADSGSTVGTLFALGTLGSILGTFLGGFYVIAWVGSHELIAWLAVVPLVLGMGFMGRLARRKAIAVASSSLLLLVALVTPAWADVGIDTGYDRYFVTEDIERATGRPVVLLARDRASIESAVYADDGSAYLLDYYKYYDLTLNAAAHGDGLDRTLMIGGGVFSYPRRQLELYPDSSTDVVEIDPKLVTLARERFALAEDSRMRIHIEDARTWLNDGTKRSNRTDAPYDVVLIDAFKSANSIPYQLTTKEAMQMAAALLDEDGMLVMNVIAYPHGRGSDFLAAEYRTLKSVFPQVEIFAVHDKDYDDTSQNISLIATKSEKSEADLTRTLSELAPDLASQRVDPGRLPDHSRILTDDFAPVDQYLLGIQE